MGGQGSLPWEMMFQLKGEEQVLTWQKHMRQEKQKKAVVGRGCHVPGPGWI